MKILNLAELKVGKHYDNSDMFESTLGQQPVPRDNQLSNRRWTHHDIRSIYQRSSEDLCDLELSLEASSSTSALISQERGPEEEDGSDDVNDLRGQGAHRAHSWTIFIYDSHHKAGDTVWCRAWDNASPKYCEYEDTEILDFVREVVKSAPYSSFYVRTARSNGDESVTLFEAKNILRALRSILDRAIHKHGIEIPSLEELKQAPLHERREKRGLLAALRLSIFKRSIVNR